MSSPTRDTTDPNQGLAGESAEDSVGGGAVPTPGTEPARPTGAAEHHHFEWWHREHPTFAALSGFFTGVAFVSLVPAMFMGLLEVFVSWKRAQEAFPFVGLFLLIPLGLVVWPNTRRFGQYMLFGILVTAVVVVGVGSFVFWLMVDRL